LDRILSIFARGAISVVLLVIGVVVASAVPSRVSVAASTLEAAPVPSLIVGMIVSFLLWPVVLIVAVVLGISLVGIVLLPVLAVAVGVALLFGLVTISAWLGKLVYGATHQGAHPNGMPVPLQVLIGLSVVLAATFLPALLRDPLPILMTGLVYLASCIGLGSAILSRFRTLAPPRHVRQYARPPAYHPTYPPTYSPPAQPEQRSEQPETSLPAQ